MKSFVTLGKHGYNFSFANGFRVIVGFGYRDQCDNYDNYSHAKNGDDAMYSCDNAEVNLYDKDDTIIPIDGKDALGYLSPEKVVCFLNFVANPEFVGCKSQIKRMLVHMEKK